MYSAFQSNAFQSNAFQIVRKSSAAPVTGGGFIYQTAGQQHRNEQAKILRERERLRLIQEELERLEAGRAEAKRLQQRQQLQAWQERKLNEALILEAGIQSEIDRLRDQRALLIRRIDDEEAALVLLLSLPFIH